jgi:hypothetical protein
MACGRDIPKFNRTVRGQEQYLRQVYKGYKQLDKKPEEHLEQFGRNSGRKYRSTGASEHT